MVDTPKTSFIPKQPTQTIPSRVPPRRKHFNVLNFIGLLVFLCGMILAVGVYLYKSFNERTLTEKKQELQELKGSFSQGDIEALRELDRRIIVSKALLDSHLSPSLVFDALELRTQHDLAFTDFSYNRRESGSVEIILEGASLRFNTLALQSKQFADAKILASTLFSDIDINDEGRVQFTATSEGDVGALAYMGTPLETASTTNATSTSPLTLPGGTATSTSKSTATTSGQTASSTNTP